MAALACRRGISLGFCRIYARRRAAPPTGLAGAHRLVDPAPQRNGDESQPRHDPAGHAARPTDCARQRCIGAGARSPAALCGGTRAIIGAAHQCCARQAAVKAGIPVVMHTPSEVKAAVTGSGRADKKQVAQMVKRLLKLKEIPKPVDSTDALALAICHHWRGVGNARLATAKKKAVKKR